MPEERRSRKKTLTWLQSHNINSFFLGYPGFIVSVILYGILNIPYSMVIYDEGLFMWSFAHT